MRASRFFFSTIAAVTLAAAARPAAAQERAVAEYRFNGTQDGDLPSRVTVADSAGAIVANYRVAGERGTRAMVVEVLETDLVLQAETPSGVLTLVLYRQNGGVEVRDGVVGTWALGDRRGKLRGRVAH